MNFYLGKDSYANTVAGFWLGYDVDKYKLNIGNASNWIKWTGTGLQIKGRLSIGGGTNEDIYFEDSGIRMYDFGDSTIKLYKSGLGNLFLALGSTESGIFSLDTNVVVAVGSSNQVILRSGSRDINLYGTGQLKLPNLASDPTENNAIGQICMVGGNLKRWDGSNWVLV